VPIYEGQQAEEEEKEEGEEGHCVHSNRPKRGNTMGQEKGVASPPARAWIRKVSRTRQTSPARALAVAGVCPIGTVGRATSQEFAVPLSAYSKLLIRTSALG
jgi:hypothetical protein